MLEETLEEDLARALVEAGPDALIVCDAEGRIALANKQAERLFGYVARELRGAQVEQLLPVRRRGVHERARERFIESAEARPMCSGGRVTGRRKDGSEFAAEVNLSPVRTGDALFVAAAVRDVSAERRMERALAAAEAQIRDLLEHAPDGIFVADLSGRFIEVNSTACRMLAYSREEMLSFRIVDLVPPEEALPLAAEREALAAHRGSARVGEWTLRRKDGGYLPVEVSATILEDGRWQAIVRDISERRRLEREAAAAAEGLRAVLSHCPVGIALVRPGEDGVRLELNERARALFQRSEDNVPLDEHMALVTHLDDRPLTRDESPSYRTLEGQQVPPTELLVRRRDGTRVPLQVRGAPLYGPDGRVSGGIVAFEDISAEKDLERLRTEWNAIVAHDLRNPLNVIVLHAELLARATGSAHPAADSIDEIRAAAAQLNRMIQDLLDLSRLEAKKLTLRPGATRIVALAQKAIARASLTAADRSITLHAPAEVPAVLVDGDRMVQVLDNLLGNAIKYGDAGTPIVVSIEPADGAVAVAVTNRGAGLSPEAKKHLFQRFRRAVEGKLASVAGVGLGLYIVRELVLAHGGEITVESVPGGETTFRFTMPIA